MCTHFSNLIKNSVEVTIVVLSLDKCSLMNCFAISMNNTFSETCLWPPNRTSIRAQNKLFIIKRSLDKIRKFQQTGSSNATTTFRCLKTQLVYNEVAYLSDQNRILKVKYEIIKFHVGFKKHMTQDMFGTFSFTIE